MEKKGEELHLTSRIISDVKAIYENCSHSMNNNYDKLNANEFDKKICEEGFIEKYFGTQIPNNSNA